MSRSAVDPGSPVPAQATKTLEIATTTVCLKKRFTARIVGNSRLLEMASFSPRLLPFDRPAEH
jgi:hypothetical protein